MLSGMNSLEMVRENCRIASEAAVGELTEEDHATLDRVINMTSDLDEVKARAKALFATLDLPQAPDALRILDEEGRELFFWSPSA